MPTMGELDPRQFDFDAHALTQDLIRLMGDLPPPHIIRPLTLADSDLAFAVSRHLGHLQRVQVRYLSYDQVDGRLDKRQIGAGEIVVTKRLRIEDFSALGPQTRELLVGALVSEVSTDVARHSNVKVCALEFEIS